MSHAGPAHQQEEPVYDEEETISERYISEASPAQLRLPSRAFNDVLGGDIGPIVTNGNGNGSGDGNGHSNGHNGNGKVTSAAVKRAPVQTSATAPAELSVSEKVRQAKLKGYEGDSCPECGSWTLVRNGTCLKCNTCGSTTGCS